MNVLSDAGRVGVWGRSGSGKSSFVKQLIADRTRVIVFDPLDEYSALKGYRAIENDLNKLRENMRKNWSDFRLAYVPKAGHKAVSLSALSSLLLAAQKPFKDGRSTQQLTLIVEEMNLSFPVHGGVNKAPFFAEICSRGRHFGIEVIGVSQRISEVSTRFRGNTTETIVFAQKGAGDTQTAAKELGCDYGKVMSLKNLEYLHEKSGLITSGKVIFKKSKNPSL